MIDHRHGGCQGFLVEAEACLRRLLQLGSDPVRTGVALSRCLRKRGDFETAVRVATSALSFARDAGSESSEARAEMARSFAAAGNLAEAIRWMETASQISPGLYEKELESFRQ
jgi:tetratricopeptide (TPR) repeat protein